MCAPQPTVRTGRPANIGWSIGFWLDVLAVTSGKYTRSPCATFERKTSILSKAHALIGLALSLEEQGHDTSYSEGNVAVALVQIDPNDRHRLKPLFVLSLTVCASVRLWLKTVL